MEKVIIKTDTIEIDFKCPKCNLIIMSIGIGELLDMGNPLCTRCIKKDKEIEMKYLSKSKASIIKN